MCLSVDVCRMILKVNEEWKAVRQSTLEYI